ncbi:hypothetical protein [Candidatus Halobonum tyrrellensis]|uniref:Transporter n=1 Tax=Candidatus Halobonum tyrrellensis G22 TaxID=1324957 RepID=V4HH00_9EURY|nr:hypothetical protein [Candidatus Halobonum tyrrellensis]ESP87119.1 hypothetical protein K933_16417 [Candidatus Halobonum tyrrellensis G22]
MSRTSAVMDALCAQRGRMQVIIAVLITMGLLLGLSVLFVDPGDRTYPILVLDAVLVVGGLAFFLTAYWYCTKRAMD